jgi:hypothetical protein
MSIRAIAAVMLAGIGACGGDAVGYDTHPVVDATVAHFAPGVQLGAGIERISVHLPARRWIDHLGAVTRSTHPVFEQVRFYTDADVRERGGIDGTAPLRAIELVSIRPLDRERTMSQVSIAFDGAQPSEGCIAWPERDRPLRSVSYWVAPDSAGGIAFVTDWMHQPAALIDSVLWSMWAWSGPFRGSETLLAPFSASACTEHMRGKAAADDASAAAVWTLERTLRRRPTTPTREPSPGRTPRP